MYLCSFGFAGLGLLFVFLLSLIKQFETGETEMRITEKTKEELFKVSPQIDFLHEICGVGHFQDVIVSSDGFFLGMRHGDIGYNDFLGTPSDIAIERTVNVLKLLTTEAQQDICRNCASQLTAVGFWIKR